MSSRGADLHLGEPEPLPPKYPKGHSAGQDSHFTVIDVPERETILIIQEARPGCSQLYVADALRQRRHYGIRLSMRALRDTLRHLGLEGAARVIGNEVENYDDPETLGLFVRNYSVGSDATGIAHLSEALRAMRVATGVEIPPSSEWVPGSAPRVNPNRGTLSAGTGFSYQPHCLHENEVGRKYIAVAGLGKMSRLSQRARALLVALSDHVTDLGDALPPSLTRKLFRDPSGGTWRHNLHAGRLLQLVSPESWAAGVGHKSRAEHFTFAFQTALLKLIPHVDSMNDWREGWSWTMVYSFVTPCGSYRFAFLMYSRKGCASHAHGIAQSLADQGTPLTPEQQSYVQHVPAPPVPAPSRATEIFEAACRQHGYADRAASTEEASAEISAPVPDPPSTVDAVAVPDRIRFDLGLKTWVGLHPFHRREWRQLSGPLPIRPPVGSRTSGRSVVVPPLSRPPPPVAGLQLSGLVGSRTPLRLQPWVSASAFAAVANAAAMISAEHHQQLVRAVQLTLVEKCDFRHFSDEWFASLGSPLRLRKLRAARLGNKTPLAFLLSDEAYEIPLVVRPVGASGHQSHAVAVFRGFVYDSLEEFSLPLQDGLTVACGEECVRLREYKRLVLQPPTARDSRGAAGAAAEPRPGGGTRSQKKRQRGGGAVPTLDVGDDRESPL